MGKDIFSGRDFRRFGHSSNSNESKKEKEHKKREKTLEKPQKQNRERKIKARIVRPGLKALPFILILILLAGVFFYLDSKFYIIKKSPKEMAEAAALDLLDIEIPKWLRAKDMEHAREMGYTSTVKSSQLEDGFWLVDVVYTANATDPRRGTDVQLRYSKILRVNATNYGVERPRSWK